ncbi:TadG family pilus assembly protein [Caballeronia sp. ATUFL_M2_KS44]|uniref:TadG family pilus assembly protein n=1 Tax=Caballeronia sp. ATUFL_M2_KS44 TaxID=2921767 RepID=UPI002540010C|nr:TadG family pilus assembly protein [Caballeronia sp. ATUFL_M2_KS44]
MAIAMPIALCMTLAVGALAVDIGHLFLARTELQTDADASALSGAAHLLTIGSGANWSGAHDAAAQAVTLNSSDGIALKDAAIATGYWNLARVPLGLQSQSITPGANDAPAVQSTVARATGSNGGPVNFFLARMLGIDSGAASASAVAIVAAPGYVAANALFPVAIGRCIYNQYWNAQTGTPVVDSSGNPPQVEIGNAQTYNGCEAGQWTSFQTTNNDVPTVRGLIANGNPAGLRIGDSIWIQSGVKTTIYSSVPWNVDVLVPVVDDVTSSAQPIVAFAAFHIDTANGASDKYIHGHFIAGYKIASVGGGVGPYYGAYVPPRLAY